MRAIQRIAIEETRLGIPLIFGFDVIHGHRTIFPIPLAEAAPSIPLSGRNSARRPPRRRPPTASRSTFAPMLDVARDPRWGRIAESPGEDPWLAARLAEAKSSRLPGREPLGRDERCGDGEAFRAPTVPSPPAATMPRSTSRDRTLHEIYLPPFEAAVRAGVATIMPAFTDLAGVPMTANVRPAPGMAARPVWGFDDVIVSDYHAIAELIAARRGGRSDAKPRPSRSRQASTST